MPRGTRRARPGSTAAGDSGPSVHAVQRGVFRKEGEYWTVGSAGKFFRLKETRGLGYIAHLLRYPGIEFHVLDLAGGIAGHREDDEPGPAQSLPRGEQDLEKAGIHIGSLGDAAESTWLSRGVTVWRVAELLFSVRDGEGPVREVPRTNVRDSPGVMVP